MIRAVFFDLDGTLLTSEKKINPSAREAILEARKKGVKIFFASARSPRLDQTLGWTKRDFDLFDGAIYANGACVQFEGREEYSKIDERAVRAAVCAVSEFEDVHISLHTPHEGYAFNFPPDDSMESGWGLSGARILSINDETIQNTVKILVFYDHLTDASRPLPKALIQKIQSAAEPYARVYVTDEGKTVQLSSLKAGKKNAIEGLMERLLADQSEIAVFGDDLNDLEMIEAFENSVAMGNGAAEIQKRAKYVTGSNDADGIAQALRMLTEK